MSDFSRVLMPSLSTLLSITSVRPGLDLLLRRKQWLIPLYRQSSAPEVAGTSNRAASVVGMRVVDDPAVVFEVPGQGEKHEDYEIRSAHIYMNQRI
jgi:hypothetical protein